MSRFSCVMEMQWSGQTLMHCKHAMQRSMSTVSMPRLRSGSVRLYSGYWRVIFCPKRCLSVTPIPFKIPCPTCGTSDNLLQDQHRCGNDYKIDQRQLDEHLPTEVHELVHPKAWDAPPDPLEGEHDKRRLEPEPDPVERSEIEEGERRLPATEEKRCGDRAHQSHRGELGRLDQRPRHTGVLDHEPADDLALPLRQVERDSLDLGDRRYVEGDEHGEQRQKIPGPERVALGDHHVHEREAPREHDYPEQAQNERHLVGDHLRSTPESPEQREGGAAAVARHHHAQSPD